MIKSNKYIISAERRDGSYQIVAVQMYDIQDDKVRVGPPGGLGSSQSLVPVDLEDLYESIEDAKKGLQRRLTDEIAILHTKLAWKEKCLEQLKVESVAAAPAAT